MSHLRQTPKEPDASFPDAASSEHLVALAFANVALLRRQSEARVRGHANHLAALFIIGGHEHDRAMNLQL